MELVRWVLTDEEEYEMIVGPAGGVYTARVSRKRHAQWVFSMMDFIAFHESIGNFPQVLAPEEAIGEAKALYRGHSFDEKILRPWESQVMVHSTTPAGYEGIMRASDISGDANTPVRFAEAADRAYEAFLKNRGRER